MRESGAEGSEKCGKLQGERHSHVISEREKGRVGEREIVGQIMRPREAQSAGYWTKQNIRTISMDPLRNHGAACGQ